MNNIQTRNRLFATCLNWYSSYGSTWFVHYVFKVFGKVKTCRLPNALRQFWLTDSRSLQGRQTTTNMDADPKDSIILQVAVLVMACWFYSLNGLSRLWSRSLDLQLEGVSP
ncbi:hypothetical protein KIW84_031429 [Lathyrus oleraceus]|uniref:Uncharacterized protein n=1 Tax=Pisum sativum TaxID=3888 RepID=A0A9D4XQH8_PEA|nr:hypothetical protein KIW84_031429 [Pisum sativum]